MQSPKILFISPLPASRWLLGLLRVGVMNVISWNSKRERYEPASKLSGLLLYAVSGCTLVFWTYFFYVSHEGDNRLTVSSVRKEIDYVRFVLLVALFVSESLLVLLLRRKKREMAETFNHLRDLWSKLGQPRLRYTLCALPALVPILSQLPLTFGRTFSQPLLEIPSSERKMYFLLSLTGQVILSWMIFVASVACLTIFIFMIYIYGALVDCITFILDEKLPLNPNQLKTCAVSIRNVFESFNKVVSTLTFFSVVSFTSNLLLESFLAIIPSEILRVTHPVDVFIAFNMGLMMIMVMCGGLAMGHILSAKLQKLRTQVFGSNGTYRAVPEAIIGEVKEILQEITHPPTAMGFFSVDLKMLASMLSFVAGYVMIFIQFKAIVDST